MRPAVDSTDPAIDRDGNLLCRPCAGPERFWDLGIGRFQIDSWPGDVTCDACHVRIPVVDVALAVYARTHYWRERVTHSHTAHVDVARAAQDAVAWASYTAMRAAGVTGADIATARHDGLVHTFEWMAGEHEATAQLERGEVTFHEDLDSMVAHLEGGDR